MSLALSDSTTRPMTASARPLVPSGRSGADFGLPASVQPRAVDAARLPAPRISRPPVQPVIEHNSELTDEQIGNAIRRGADALLARFGPTTRLLAEARDPDGYGRGMDILCV